MIFLRFGDILTMTGFGMPCEMPIRGYGTDVHGIIGMRFSDYCLHRRCRSVFLKRMRACVDMEGHRKGAGDVKGVFSRHSGVGVFRMSRAGGPAMWRWHQSSRSEHILTHPVSCTDTPVCRPKMESEIRVAPCQPIWKPVHSDAPGHLFRALPASDSGASGHSEAFLKERSVELPRRGRARLQPYPRSLFGP